LSGLGPHPSAPAAEQPAAAVLVERCRRCVAEALDGIEPASPAFALCLFPSDDPDELAPVNIALGLETDRAKALEKSPSEAFDDVWNPTRYSYISLDEFSDPSDEPEFEAASATVLGWLDEALVADPARWVLEETAAALTREPPLELVTDDFICWVFEQGHELTTSLKWIAPPELQEKLAAKGLLDDPEGDDDA
jgi:hypothetical protein